MKNYTSLTRCWTISEHQEKTMVILSKLTLNSVLISMYDEVKTDITEVLLYNLQTGKVIRIL